MVALSDQKHLPILHGIYEVPEAARYLKATTYADVVYPLSSPKLIRWIRRGLASPDIIDLPGRDLLIAFEDLISMRVISALKSAGVKWSEIYEANLWLRSHLGVQRPFATETIWVGQGQIFAEWTKRLISASRHGQMALELLWQYVIPIHGLTFDEKSKVATSWEPVDSIVLEPRIQFGAPCIKGTRIPTRTISGMVEAGDSAHWVANAFSLSLEEVWAACDWESRLRAN